MADMKRAGLHCLAKGSGKRRITGRDAVHPTSHPIVLGEHRLRDYITGIIITGIIGFARTQAGLAASTPTTYQENHFAPRDRRAKAVPIFDE